MKMARKTAPWKTAPWNNALVRLLMGYAIQRQLRSVSAYDDTHRLDVSSLTPWYDVSARPARVGTYLVQSKVVACECCGTYAKWTGLDWTVQFNFGRVSIPRTIVIARWRGLVAEARGSRQ